MTKGEAFCEESSSRILNVNVIIVEWGQSLMTSPIRFKYT